MNRPHSHCPNCGAELPEEKWPRTCTDCQSTHFLNPTPVAVLLQPVDGGLLTVRRAIEPRRGDLALPGGFIDLDESWKQAAARELREETGIAVDPDDIDTFDVVSAPDGTVLVFGIAPELESDAVAGFTPTPEVSEVAVVREPTELAFPIHTDVLAESLCA